MTRLFNVLEMKERRRRLRRDETRTEKMFWSQVRNRRLGGYKFFRQYSVGSYVLDFYCTKARLAIELDGPYHDTREQRGYDETRTAYLASVGIQVLRFRNEELDECSDKVLAVILAALDTICRRTTTAAQSDPDSPWASGNSS